jgi:hypothetical protein
MVDDRSGRFVRGVEFLSGRRVEVMFGDSGLLATKFLVVINFLVL